MAHLILTLAATDRKAALALCHDPKHARFVACHVSIVGGAVMGWGQSPTKAFQALTGRNPRKVEVALFRLRAERAERNAPITQAPIADRLLAWKMRYRPRLQVAALVGLIKQIETALTSAQSHCSARTLNLREAFQCIRDAARDGAADTGSVSVAKSYGYRHTWTRATAKCDGAVVRWGVERVGGGPAALTHEVSRHALMGVCFNPCLRGDAFAIRHGSNDVAVRYASNGERTGVAIAMPPDLRTAFGAWEHGATREACRVEITRKRAVVKEQARAKRLAARHERRVRLLARLTTTLTAGYDDARAVGYCEPGIAAWAAERGIALNATVPISMLMKDTDRRAQAVALRVARKALEAIRSESVAA